MARCSNCGKNNKDGSLFCQDCGRKIEEAPRPTPVAGAAPAATAPCASCGTVNPPGMNFCKMCGSALSRAATGTGPTVSAARPVAGASAAVPVAVPAGGGTAGKITCPSCAKLTPPGFAFCQHCGTRLGAAKSATAEALASTMAPSVSPTPPAGLRPPTPAAFAPTVAPVLPTPTPTQRSPQPTDEAVSFGRLVVLLRDGSDGATHDLIGDRLDVGRTDGELTFDDDPYMAARHARITFDGSTARVRSLDDLNGIYLRLREASELQPGDHILLGKEVLRFESVTADERDPPAVTQHGVLLLGSTQRESWGRLREITCSGTTRNLWHLTRPEFVLGREEGDVVFPDDEFMSRRHAALRRAGATGKARLEDMGSSNGTFLRIRGEHQLRTGDVLRVGDQLLRFEG